MADFRIRGRIEPRGENTYVAKVWVSNATTPEDDPADVIDVCHPCDLVEVRKACRRFVDKVAEKISAAGHHVIDIHID